MYKWNKPYNLIMSIKRSYVSKYGLDTLCFETWLKKLNEPYYNSIFDCLEISQYNEFLLIRYGIGALQPSMWKEKDSIYREFRSIVIDLVSEEIVLCPFRKFFNIDETEDTSQTEILKRMKNAKHIEFTNKLDGSMQSVRYYDNQFIMSGSREMDKSKSWRLTDGYNMLTDNHKRMIKDNSDFTFIFEFISLKDAHVVIYKKEQEGLYLIGARNVFNGNELNYCELKEIADNYNVSMTEIENITLEEAIEKTKTIKCNEKEGWVLNLDGFKVKIKCDDYVELHSLIGFISSPNTIIKNIAEDRYDDMLSKIPQDYRNRICDVADLVFKYKLDMNEKICYNYSIAPKDDRKTFMLWVDNNCPKDVLAYVKNTYNNKPYNVLKKGNCGYKKLSDMGINLKE